MFSSDLQISFNFILKLLLVTHNLLLKFEFYFCKENTYLYSSAKYSVGVSTVHAFDFKLYGK